MAGSQLYCRIRKEWVTALPEENVRQRLISAMLDSLGYPAALIAVEKGLRQMPHIGPSANQLPDRRADIVCFGNGIHPHYPLYPLLLLECKAVPLTSAVVQQVAGYNHYIKAYFVAVANQDEIKTGRLEVQTGRYGFFEGLPSYQQLLAAI